MGFVNDAASAESARSDLLAIAAEVAAMEWRDVRRKNVLLSFADEIAGEGYVTLANNMRDEAARAMEGE